MIDYNELDKYFIGTAYRITMNAGGILVEGGEDYISLFYKVSDDLYFDVKNNIYTQDMSKGAPLVEHAVLYERNLRPIGSKLNLFLSSGPVKTLTFNPKKCGKYQQSHVKRKKKL